MKWRVVLSLVVAVGMSVVLIRTVKAVHDLDFELDGNALNGGDRKFDWADLFDANGEAKDPLPAGFPNVGFERDFGTGAPNAQNPNGVFVNADPPHTRPAARTFCRSQGGSAPIPIT